MTRRTILTGVAALVGVRSAAAATKINLNQIGASPLPQGGAVVELPTGQFAVAALGSNLALGTSSTGQPVLNDTVTVTASPVFVDNETPGGAVNGSNTVFTLANAPKTVQLYRNGLLQASTVDFTLSGNTITFQATSVPQAGDTLLANYRL